LFVIEILSRNGKGKKEKGRGKNLISNF